MRKKRSEANMPVEMLELKLVDLLAAMDRVHDL